MPLLPVAQAAARARLICWAMLWPAAVAMVMGMVANKQGLDVTGMTTAVTLTLSDGQPRRVASITAIFTVPAHIPADALDTLRQAAGMCPVHNSLHPEVNVQIEVVSA